MISDIQDKIKPAQEFILSENILKGIKYAFNDASVFDDFKNRAYVAIKYSKSLQAYKLLKELEKNLSQQEIAVKAKYSQVLTWLYYAGFDNLTQGEVLDLFGKKNFVIIFQDEDYNDLIGKIKFRLSAEPMEDRDKWREKIYNAIHENENIFIQEKKETIANWVKKYDNAVGADIAESIKRADFENEKSNEAHLDAPSKAMLKRFLDFYEFMKISSYDPAGFEEPIIAQADGKVYLFDNGQQIEISSAQKAPAQAKKQSQQTSTPVKAPEHAKSSIPRNNQIIQTARSILKNTSGNTEQVLNNLDKSVSSKDALNALSCLVLLAQLRKLDDILSDARFNSIVSDDLKKAGTDEKVQTLKINPQAPQFIARFLKVVLENKLGLSNGDAISFGNKLAQILSIESEKYQNIIKNNKWNI